MSVDTARAKSLFLAASDFADPAERAAYLDRECGGGAELRARVEALLRANDASPLPEPGLADVTSAHGLDAPAAAASADNHGKDERAGTVIARKYTLVEVIGEGGMGSVWRAKQTEPVKRFVAVKLIKAGMDSKQVLARFEAERQALALMDHPNIAKVLDGGIHDGRPYFVMELVKGVPITDYCDKCKLTPKERLELFVSVCEAIQHAHQKGIIHRDVKPSNVLIALYDRPVVKVIDFGVAKATGVALTERTIDTGFGGVVGTPQYMSPEQATFNNLDVDTRSDVYALGVLLYELLTGSPPFASKELEKRGLLEILRVVREEEPPRPSTKLSTADALPTLSANRGTEPKKLAGLLRNELDWIVMKALEKDRARRYETANGFAADIQRFLSGEAVQAHPPSAGYRLKKFVKRHRGQVLAASLVLLVLVAGIVGTTLGLVVARENEMAAVTARNEEVVARNDAVAARNDAVAARNALAQANTELVASNDKLLSGAARSLLRPLAVQVQPNQPLPPLNEQEVEPLWELAASTDEHLRLRFVEVALHEPVLARRLTDRAAFAFHAAVGLGPRRRTRVEELLGKRLEATEISPEEQEYVALCLAHLGVLDRRLAGRTADALAQAMSKTTDPSALQCLAQGLAAVSARLEPQDAVRVRGHAVAALIQAMSKTWNSDALQSLAGSLSALATRMESKEAADITATLIRAMSKSELKASYLAKGLGAAATRLEPKEASQTAATLVQAMSKATTPVTLDYLAQDLLAVATRLKPAEAAASLTQAITRSGYDNNCDVLAQGLSATAARLEPKDAAEVAATLTQAFTETRHPAALRALADEVSAVSAHLEPKAAARACAQAAATLSQAIGKTNDTNALFYLAEGVCAVATRLEPKDAAQTAATLTQKLATTAPVPFASSSLARGVAAVSARLEPKEAAQLCGPVAVTLIQAMSKTTNPNHLRLLAEGVSALAARLEPGEAAQVCGQAVAALTREMNSTTDPGALQTLTWGLSAPASHLESQAAAQTAAALIEAMNRTSDQNALPTLAQGLSAVATRLGPKEAGQTAATLIQAMTKTGNPNVERNMGDGLAAVSARLEPKEVATLIQAMSKSTDSSAPYALASLAQSLLKVSARLEPKEAAQLCGQAAAALAPALSKAGHPDAMSQLAWGLAAVSARLEPKQATQVCGPAAATLTQAISKTTDPDDLYQLALGLADVSARLEPKQAAQVCGPAAAALTQAISKTTNPDTWFRPMEGLPASSARSEAWFRLAEGLSALSARLGPKEAAQSAAALIQAISKTADPNNCPELARGLSALLAPVDSTRARQRLLSMTATVLELGGPGQPYAALAFAQPAFESAPPPLPTQTLVDLLKHPFCVGEPRRLVLDQLARHYHRPFADQWDFVAFAEEKKLSLDFTSPPQQR